MSQHTADARLSPAQGKRLARRLYTTLQIGVPASYHFAGHLLERDAQHRLDSFAHLPLPDALRVFDTAKAIADALARDDRFAHDPPGHPRQFTLFVLKHRLCIKNRRFLASALDAYDEALPWIPKAPLAP